MKINRSLTSIVAPGIIGATTLLAPSGEAAPFPGQPGTPVTPLAFAAKVSVESPPIPFPVLRAVILVGGGAAGLSLLAAFMFRRVVSTNMVHIVQSGKKTVSYGSSLPDGNVYYEIPTWVPSFGVSVIKLPVSNFDLSLEDYEAYDEDRVPFLVDVTAFFRVEDPVTAAKRISNVNELKNQLGLIVQGAVRKVLASDKIDNIMTQRSTFGESFSQEVAEELAEWGVTSVKTMELMDIRDSPKSSVIANIMAKKTSEIEKDSRITVSENERLAAVAEAENRRDSEISMVNAERDIQVSREASKQQVGERTALSDKMVGVAQELSRQEVLIAKAQTKEKDLEVVRVDEIRTAEIERDKELVLAEKEKKVATIAKETAVVKASQDKETTILMADGQLEAEKRHADAVRANGIAQGDADKAKAMAPVEAQIALAQEIGTNEAYQKYLAMIEAVRAYVAVGTEQAKSLQQAEVKVIANGGSTSEGLRGVSDLFSSKGGTSIAAAIEGLAQSDFGADFLSKVLTKSQE